MSKTIWKFQLTPDMEFVELPGIITKVCHVAAEYDNAQYIRDAIAGKPPGDAALADAERVTVWVEFDKSGIPFHVPLAIVGTGHEVPPKLDHVGTAVMPSGLVWHLYMNTDYMRLCCGGGPQYGHAWSCPKYPD